MIGSDEFPEFENILASLAGANDPQHQVADGGEWG